MFVEFDDSEFFEPTGYEGALNNLVEEIRGSVKAEITTVMNRLQEENAQLQDVKKRWNELKAEQEKAIREATYEKQNAVEQAKKIRVNEILQEISTTAYAVVAKYEYKYPKCDKCNEERKILFKSPRGVEHSEDCTCSERVYQYIAEECKVVKFYENEDKPNKTIRAFACKPFDGNNQWKDASQYLVDDRKFEAIQVWYKPIFLSKERAEAYCQWLNDKEKKGENDA